MKKFVIFSMSLSAIFLSLFLTACGGGDTETNVSSNFKSRVSTINKYGVFGQLISTTTLHYDADGYRIKRTTDKGSNGSDDYITYYHYNGVRKVTTQTQDQDADGTIDSSWTYHYADGQPAYVVITNAADKITNAHYYKYDANKVSSIEYDYNYDGAIDETVSISYDDIGKVLLVSYAGASVGTYLYDANGRLSSFNYDASGDGTIDEVSEYVFESGPCVQHIPTSLYQSYCAE